MRVPVGAPSDQPLFRLVVRQAYGGMTLGQSFVGARESAGMREEVASYGFLAVTVAGLVLLFTGLVAFAFG